MFKCPLWMIWWPFPLCTIWWILTITFAVNIHLAESNCFQMEISDNMRVYSETPRWIHYHMCFKHDQLQSDLSSFVQWRTRDYNELHLASIQTAETVSQTFHSTYIWGSAIPQINARALRRFVPAQRHFPFQQDSESLYSCTLHEAKYKQQRNAFSMRGDRQKGRHLEDSTSSVDWDSHWHSSSLRLGVGGGRIRAWA